MNADIGNAVFEAGSAVLLWLNVRRLCKDQSIAGVSLVPAAWFSAWGFWNIFYYWHLGQRLSWLMGLFVCVANTTWVLLALYLRRRQRENNA